MKGHMHVLGQRKQHHNLRLFALIDSKCITSNVIKLIKRVPPAVGGRQSGEKREKQQTALSHYLSWNYASPKFRVKCRPYDMRRLSKPRRGDLVHSVPN